MNTVEKCKITVLIISMVLWPISITGTLFFLHKCQAHEAPQGFILSVMFVCFIPIFPLSVVHLILLVQMLSSSIYSKIKGKPVSKLDLAGLVYYFIVLLVLLLMYRFNIKEIFYDILGLYALYWFVLAPPI